MHAVSWFDIPVADFDRALTFYQKIFDFEMIAGDAPSGGKMAMFPADPTKGEISGAIVQHPDYTPGDIGSVVYLNGGDDLALVLDRVEGAGGTVLGPKTSIGEHGFVGYFKDTEGNKIGLHSNG